LPPQKDGDQAARKQSLPCTSFAQAGCEQRAARSCPAGRGRRGLVGVNGPHEALRPAPAALGKLAGADSVRHCPRIPLAVLLAILLAKGPEAILPGPRRRRCAIETRAPRRPPPLARRRRTEAVNATGPCWLALMLGG